MRSRIYSVVVIGSVVAAMAVAAFAFAACGGSSDSPGDAADVTFIGPGDFALADYAGKPLVLNFFGSWCGPCNAEAPELAAFAKAHADVQFVGIAVDDNEDEVASFMSEYGLTYAVVMDDNSLSSQFGITGVPETFFFNAAGEQKDHIIGAAGSDRFEAGLAAAL